MSEQGEDFDTAAARALGLGLKTEAELDVLTDAIASGSRPEAEVASELAALAPTAELCDGGRAICTGLAGRADLNGQRVQLVSYNADAGRWTVQCDGGESVNIRAVNLEATNVIECPVCLEGRGPHQMENLACGHPLCSPCLARIHKDSALRKCPLCRGALINVGAGDQMALDEMNQRADKILAHVLDSVYVYLSIYLCLAISIYL